MTPRFLNMRDGGNMTRPRPGLIRSIFALAILPPLFWYAPDIMRAIGGMW